MTETFSYQNLTLAIIRSPRRKTIAIQIKAGQIFMRIPQSLPKTEIQQVMLKKSRWIHEKLNFQAQIDPLSVKQFSEGEEFSYLGQAYPLVIAQGIAPRLVFYHQQLVVIVRDKQADNRALIKRLLIRWYQQQATDYLQEKTRHFAEMMAVSPVSVQVKTFKARWGSCSSTGEIHYNWKIIMATPWVVDYVVIHELSHLLHHNHSPQFWKTVAIYLPDYRAAQAWLKLHGSHLAI